MTNKNALQTKAIHIRRLEGAAAVKNCTQDLKSCCLEGPAGHSQEADNLSSGLCERTISWPLIPSRVLQVQEQ